MKDKRSIADMVDDAVASAVIKSVTCDPDRQLSDVGFKWACFIAMKRHWPDVTFQQAVDWLLEYIGVKVGTDGYDWSYSAAKRIAKEYAGQFGEGK
jgi:hypothetical protein